MTVSFGDALLLPLEEISDEFLVILIQKIRQSSQVKPRIYPKMSNALALEKAIYLLYTRHERPLISYLNGLCQMGEFAKDVYQETWKNVWRTIDDWQHKARFSTFLYTVARNCLSNLYFRKEQKKIFATDSMDDENNGIANTLHTCDLSDELLRTDRVTKAYHGCLQKLSIVQREAFLLSHNHDMTASEVSEVVGVKMETAKTRIRYAIDGLRQCLKDFIE